MAKVGDTCQVKFPRAGSYPYFARSHVTLGMKGVVTVGNSAGGRPTTTAAGGEVGGSVASPRARPPAVVGPPASTGRLGLFALGACCPRSDRALRALLARLHPAQVLTAPASEPVALACPGSWSRLDPGQPWSRTALPTDVPELATGSWPRRCRPPGGRRSEPDRRRAPVAPVHSSCRPPPNRAVAEFTGLGGELPPPVAEPLDRGQWVEANMATLRRILRPWPEGGPSAGWKASVPVPTAMLTSTRAIAGAQAGNLLGYVARVLGQYTCPCKANGWGTVWYVVPNSCHRAAPPVPGRSTFRLWIPPRAAHRRHSAGCLAARPHPGAAGRVPGVGGVDDEAIRRLTDRLQGPARRVIAGERIELLALLVTRSRRASWTGSSRP